MRLITWNCKGAFHRKHDFIAALHPDVLIVPECEKLSEVSQTIDATPVRKIDWFGSNPRKGLAVISYGDYTFELHSSYDPRHKWIVPLSISGPLSFVLLAVWTLPFGDQRSKYVRPVLEACESYKTLIYNSESKVVWAGDFNSNSSHDTPLRKYKFRDLVTLLEQHGFHSVYHHQHKCDHGKEPDKTYYRHNQADKGYHIDYVFTTDRFHPYGFEVSVGSHADWSKRSDHSPLACEFYECPPMTSNNLTHIKQTLE
jgi:exodeoxyribonuclease III